MEFRQTSCVPNVTESQNINAHDKACRFWLGCIVPKSSYVWRPRRRPKESDMRPGTQGHGPSAFVSASTPAKKLACLK